VAHIAIDWYCTGVARHLGDAAVRITGNSYRWNGGKRTVSSVQIVRWFR
jgi:hypothetical protein